MEIAFNITHVKIINERFVFSFKGSIYVYLWMKIICIVIIAKIKINMVQMLYELKRAMCLMSNTGGCIAAK